MSGDMTTACRLLRDLERETHEKCGRQHLNTPLEIRKEGTEDDRCSLHV